jgi:diguanylate cyclase (GGDEF)-like protein
VRGALAVERAAGGRLPSATERRLAAFAELAAIALANAERGRALSAEAREDELTGIGNRRAFTERLTGEVERARRYAGPLSLVLIDLDRFKRVNDTLGHQVGDAVLVETTRRLAALVRGGELVARIGGDELAWLLPETGVRGAVRAAERALEAIGTGTFGAAGSITASAGVAGLRPGDGPSELVGRADGALLRAKADGAGAVRCADAPDQTESPPSRGYESPAR